MNNILLNNAILADGLITNNIRKDAIKRFNTTRCIRIEGSEILVLRNRRIDRAIDHVNEKL